MRILVASLFIFLGTQAFADNPPERIYDEGTLQGVAFNLNCVGSGITCTHSGTTGTITVSGGGSSQWDDATGGINYADGNVGVNSTSPSALLDVRDTTGTLNSYIFKVHTKDDGPFLAGFFNDTYSTTTPAAEYFAWSSASSPFASGDFEMGTPAAKSFFIYTDGYTNPRMVVTGDGNVGIGTAFPPTKLYVAGSLTGTSTVSFPGLGGGTGKLLAISNTGNVTATSSLGTGNLNTLQYNNNGAQAGAATTEYNSSTGNLILGSSSGNVGIGDDDNAPSAKLRLVSGYDATSTSTFYDSGDNINLLSNNGAINLTGTADSLFEFYGNLTIDVPFGNLNLGNYSGGGYISIGGDGTTAFVSTNSGDTLTVNSYAGNASLSSSFGFIKIGDGNVDQTLSSIDSSFNTPWSFGPTSSQFGTGISGYVTTINGNVSIGTSSTPVSALEVKGLLTTVLSGTDPLKNTIAYSTPAGQPGIIIYSSTGKRADISNNGTVLKFTSSATSSQSSTSFMVLDTNGNVGIGTLNPGQALDVSGNARVLGRVYFDDAGANQIYSSNSHGGADMIFTAGSSGTEHMRVSGSNGIWLETNVGIGTTAPRANLNVGGNIYLDRSTSQIIMKDGTGGTCTQITTQSGVVSGAVVTCP